VPADKYQLHKIILSAHKKNSNTMWDKKTKLKGQLQVQYQRVPSLQQKITLAVRQVMLQAYYKLESQLHILGH
jgi:hypothetical protein